MDANKYFLEYKNRQRYMQKAKLAKKFNAVITNLEYDISSKSGILANVPFDLKDNIVTKGVLTTAGSKTLCNYIPPYNSTVYAKLINEGATLVSKSNLEELGQGGVGENPHYGNILNPFNTDYVPGGSSSGASVLVSIGAVPFSIGTDTGDSIRRPATFCGVVGFKPTWGRISRYGVIPYSPSLDTVGIIGKNVTIIQCVYDILKGKDPKDLTSLKEVEPKNISLDDLSPRNKNIVVLKNVYNAITNPIYLKKFDALLEELKLQGWNVVFKEFNPELFAVLLFVYKIISNSESISCCSNITGLTFGNRIDGDGWKETFIKTRTHGFGVKVKSRFLLGLFSTDDKNQTRVLSKAKKIRTKINNEFERILGPKDMLFLPLTDNGPELYKQIKGMPIIKLSLNPITDHLLLGNFTGAPSITIPIGYLKNKLPIGVSLTTKPKTDNLCLQYGRLIEKIAKFENYLQNRNEK